MIKLLINFLIIVLLTIILGLLCIWSAILHILPIAAIITLPYPIMENRELIIPYIIGFIFSAFTWYIDFGAFDDKKYYQLVLPWTKYPWIFSQKLIKLIRSINNYSKRIKNQT